MKNLFAILILFAFAFSDSAWSAPKKKAAPKAKAKVASTSKKSRAPASVKSSRKIASKNTKAQFVKKGSKQVSSASKKAPPRKPASPTKNNEKSISQSSDPSQVASSRTPSGMAGLGLASGAMNASKALEIRGQARTLSMMLILRNGKENLNFVKVRQDYAPEIAKTEY